MTFDILGCIIILVIWLIVLLKSFRLAIIMAIMLLLIRGFLNRLVYYFQCTVFSQLLSSSFLFVMPIGMLILCFFILLAKYAVCKKALIKHSLDKFMLAYIILAFLQIFNPNGSIPLGMIGFVSGTLPAMGMYFLSREALRTSDEIRGFLKIMFIYGIISCLYGVWQVIFGLPTFESLWFEIEASSRASNWYVWGPKGLVLRPVGFCYGNMGLVYPISLLAVFSLVKSPNIYDHKWEIIFLFSFLLFLIVSLSRAAFGTFVIGGVFYVGLLGRQRKRMTMVLLAIIIVAALWGIFSLASPALKATEIGKFVRFGELANPLEASTVRARGRNQWYMAWQAFKAYPLGGGTGTGSARRGVAMHLLENMTGKLPSWIGPHNDFLKILVELGIPGLILFIVILTKIGTIAMEEAKKSTNIYLCRISCAIIAGEIAYIALSMFNVPLTTASSGTLFWFLVGIIPLLSKIEHIENISLHSQL